MSLSKLDQDYSEKNIYGRVVSWSNKCIVTMDLEERNIMYVFDSDTKELLYKFNCRFANSGGYIQIELDGKSGIFNAIDGSIHIEPKYKAILGSTFIYYKQKLPFFAQIENDKLVLLDFFGNRLNDQEYDGCEEFIRGKSVVMKMINGEKKYGVVTDKGETFLEIKYDSIYWDKYKYIGIAKEEGTEKFFCGEINTLFIQKKHVLEISSRNMKKEFHYILTDSSGVEFLYKYIE